MHFPISKKASTLLPLQIGFLFIAIGFLVLSLDYAKTVGVFYAEKDLPVLLFSKEIESIVSSVYSIPEDVNVTYNGPNVCRWDAVKEKYVCQGGIQLEEIGAETSFTKDEKMVYLPTAHCLYISFMPAAMKIASWAKNKIGSGWGSIWGKLTKRLGDEHKLIKLGNWLSSSYKAAKAKWWRFKGRFSIRSRLKYGMSKGELFDEIAPFGAFAELSDDQIRTLIDAGLAGEKTADDAITTLLGGLEEVDPADADVLADLLKLDWKKLEEAAKRAGFAGSDAVVNYLKSGKWSDAATVSGIRNYFNRDNLMSLARVAGAYASCVSDNPFLDFMAFILSGQFYFKFDRNYIYHFHDFYAGKFGAIYFNFTDGEDYIEHHTMFALNGEDMCFLRKHLTILEDNYSITPFEIDNGVFVFSKSKKSFDTLCDPDYEYYPDSLEDVVKAVFDASKEGDTSITVYLGPGKDIIKKDGKLCESKIARTTDGRNSSWFDIYCYDFNDMGVDVVIEFDRIGIDYTRLYEPYSVGPILYDPTHSLLLPKTFGPFVPIEEESGNEYWFKHPSSVDYALDFGVAMYIQGLTELLDSIPPWEIPGPGTSNSPEIKLGFFQTQYFKCEIQIERQAGTIYLRQPECEPVMYMNWESIFRDDMVDLMSEPPVNPSYYSGSYIMTVTSQTDGTSEGACWDGGRTMTFYWFPPMTCTDVAGINSVFYGNNYPPGSSVCPTCVPEWFTNGGGQRWFFDNNYADSGWTDPSDAAMCMDVTWDGTTVLDRDLEEVNTGTFYLKWQNFPQGPTMTQTVCYDQMGSPVPCSGPRITKCSGSCDAAVGCI